MLFPFFLFFLRNNPQKKPNLCLAHKKCDPRQTKRRDHTKTERGPKEERGKQGEQEQEAGAEKIGERTTANSRGAQGFVDEEVIIAGE